ncbi:hypothetical protein M23134_05845 [Microscilla marina ATCC 23134]|uniref:Uncharacterized protein n=1 Tax=Microscilla marina ATCC 23134 TaxID=313606 RepID=A1ZXJ4_MICM2|nr:hypothetical protein M23134_05845 [Microscilla marina ATCC 23134]
MSPFYQTYRIRFVIKDIMQIGTRQATVLAYGANKLKLLAVF